MAVSRNLCVGRIRPVFVRMKKTILNKNDLKIILIALGLHWLATIASYVVMRAGDANYISFLAMLTERFTTAGDSPHYLSIASEGYQSTGEKANLIVFYPLYPFLMRIIGYVTGSNTIAGILISQISFCGSCLVLFRLIALDYSQKDAWFGVLLFCLYPFCIFTMGIFTEGLFLLLTLLSLYSVRKHRFGCAGIFGFLSALTRIQGVLLFAPALYELIVAKKYRAFWRILPIPAGLGVYLLINRIIQGDWFRFLEHQAAPPWYQTSKWVSENLAQHISMGQQYPGLAYIIYYVQVALFFITIAAMFFALSRNTRTSYIVYGAAYLIVTYFSGWMISGGRYMLGCVPIFLVLGKLKMGWGRNLVFLISGILCFIYTTLYLIGHAIM